MKITGIFAIIKPYLYSVIYSNESNNEFENILKNWRDAEYLDNFFERNIEDLSSGFFGEINIDDASERTMEEADLLEDMLYDIANGTNEKYPTLQSFFKPLSSTEISKEFHQKNKAYGLQHKSWLRLYAIRIGPNTFVISGGSIKLTENMNEREHLLTELSKLESTKNYLNEKGLFDPNDFELLESR